MQHSKKRPIGAFFADNRIEKTHRNCIYFGGVRTTINQCEVEIVAEFIRKCVAKQIMELWRSLREFGFVNPLLIDKDKKIIAKYFSSRQNSIWTCKCKVHAVY